MTPVQQLGETTPNLGSIAHERQSGIGEVQDMQDKVLGTAFSPATGGERRLSKEEPNCEDRRYTSRRRSGNIDKGESIDKGMQPGSKEAGGRLVAMPPPELGVQVIDKGTTKQLVLTTGERPTATMVLDGAIRQPGLIGEPKDRRHSRHGSDIDPDEGERSRAFRERFAAVVLGENVEPPFVSGVSPEVMKPEESAQVSQPTHDEYARVPVPGLRDKYPTALLSTATSSPDVVQPYSVCQSPRHPPPTSLGMHENKPPELTHVDENLWDLSPASSTVSPGRLDFGKGRTAKYVQEQASFHDTLPSSYNQESPRSVRFRDGDNGDSPIPRSTLILEDGGISCERTKASAPARKGSPKRVEEARHEYLHQGPNLAAKDLPLELPRDVQYGAGRSQSKSRRKPELNFGADLTEVTNFDDTGADDEGRLLHFRSDFLRHLADVNSPALFFLRPNEGLAVTRVEGTGRLLVSLRGETGDRVLVDGAVVYDSAADFAHSATLVRLWR